MIWSRVKSRSRKTVRPRKIYSITAKGTGRNLENGCSLHRNRLNSKIPSSIQLAWADLLNPEELDTLLEKVRSRNAACSYPMLQVQETTRKYLDPSRNARDAYINATLARTPREAVLWSMIQEELGLVLMQNELNWVRKLRGFFQCPIWLKRR